MTRYLVMHATDARWEAGETPGPELIANVGALMGELAKSGALLGGEGLRASSLGARLESTADDATLTPGPLRALDVPPAAFAIVRAQSLDDALARARDATGLPRDVAIEVRPVTEAWDIGLAPRPERLDKRRFMLLFLANDELSGAVRPALKRLFARWRAEGELLASEILQPTSRGKRVRTIAGEQTISDGPFTETKELVAGYALVRLSTLDEAVALAKRYAATVESACVDLRVADEP